LSNSLKGFKYGKSRPADTVIPRPANQAPDSSVISSLAVAAATGLRGLLL
jgi:hypothetical protein